MWTGNVNQGNGYGRLRGDGRYQPAHRVSYEIFNGPIPEGLVVRHKTDIPLDVNPRNLELGTVADNARDCVERQRQVRGERQVHAVLNPHIVRVMRVGHENGRTIASLAREYHVAETTVRNAVRRWTWKHI
ncbi:HNH endonuclease [Rhodococcus erythropolis]|uniref:HNH endonuclease n=1 Tax=Rhodococcus erythropolis TaxID=1833 RepID=UPI00366B53BF